MTRRMPIRLINDGVLDLFRSGDTAAFYREAGSGSGAIAPWRRSVRSPALAPNVPGRRGDPFGQPGVQPAMLGTTLWSKAALL